MRPRLKNLKGFASKTKPNNASSSTTSYLAEDENFKGFAAQLERLGLQLRDITGDGNCCFRALSDQMYGNESAHVEFRKRVCQYMRNNRDEFEPFVAALIDDDEEEEQQQSNGGGEIVNRIKRSTFLNKKLDAFEKYIKNLEQPGTYADNGCLVAFARLYQVNINIHQLNMPIWNISGVENKKGVRELHLSYHNGEHYSSIRPLGDNTQTPTNINFELAAKTNKSSPHGATTSSARQKSAESKKTLSSNNKTNNSNNNYNGSRISGLNEEIDGDEYYYQTTTNNDAEEYDLNVKIEQVMDVTGCMDVGLIRELLSMNDHDSERTINLIIANRMHSVSIEDGESEDDEVAAGASGGAKAKKRVNKKQEKKERQMERQQLKVIEQREKEIMNSGLKGPKSGSKTAGNESTSNTSSISSAAAVASSSSTDCTDFNVSLSNIETKTI